MLLVIFFAGVLGFVVTSYRMSRASGRKKINRLWMTGMLFIAVMYVPAVLMLVGNIGV